MGDIQFRLWGVWQAQEIVARQARCVLYEALAEMKERAQTDGRTLEDIATAVASGKIKFD